MNRAKVQAVFACLLIFSAFIVGFTVAQTPPGPNTLQQGEGGNMPTLTAQYGYFYGIPPVNVTGRLFGDYTGLPLTGTTLDTGQGANELYDMDQNVLTTSNVAFNQVNAAEYWVGPDDRTDVFKYPQQPVPHIIWTDGASYYVKEGVNSTVASYGDFDDAFNGIAAANAVICILDGRFVYNASSNFDDNMLVYGMGNATTIIPASGVTAPAFVLSGDDYCELSRLTINGNSSATDGVTHATSRNSYIHRLSIRDTTQTGIKILGQGSDLPRQGSTIEGNTIYNVDTAGANGKGIAIGPSSKSDYHLIQKNRIYDCDYAIYSSYGTSVDSNLVSENMISYCTYGVYLTGAGKWGIADNSINHNDYAVWLATCNHINVNDNEITGNNNTAIYGTETTTLTVDGNNLNGDTNTLHLKSCTNVTVTSNTFYQTPTPTWDLLVETAGTNIVVKNNQNLEKISGVASIETLEHNIGFVTENSGTATITALSVSITVPHGLSYTPTLQDIKVTPTNSLGLAAQFWISDPTAATFDINVDIAPGVGTATFVWNAQRTP